MVPLAARSAALGTLLVTAACARAGAPPPLPTRPAADLAALQAAPDQAGEQIYEGRVFSLDTTRRVPLYRYERRVRATDHGQRSTHITRDPDGLVVVTQDAEHDDHYALRRATLTQAQSGLAATVTVTGNRAEFTRSRGGAVDTAVETITEPVVAGATMFGFILAHWRELTSAHPVRMRFAVLERNESIPFVLEQVSGRAGEVTVRMTPTRWLVRLAVPPTYFRFDANSRNAIGYEGRVPPLERVGDEWKTLDARVVYAFTAAAFR